MALSGWKTGWVALAGSGLALVGCNDRPTQKEAGADATAAAAPKTVTAAPAAAPSGDALAAQDAAPAGSASQPFADAEARPTMQLQAVLDRLGFAPGSSMAAWDCRRTMR
jgi:hypothetical protein